LGTLAVERREEKKEREDGNFVPSLAVVCVD
jgi:hypothetical protein